MEREQAFALLTAEQPEPHMVQHALASESVMQRLAGHFGEDAAQWGITGLLHDIDFPHTRETPEQHGVQAEAMLAGKLAPELVYAIKAHNSEYTGAEPKSRLDYALRAAETVTGLIAAAALMRPTGMEGMEVKSIKKKMKDKAFAASVSRERIKECEQAGVPLDIFLALSIEAMQGQQVVN